MEERRFIPGTGHAYSCDKSGNIYSHYISGTKGKVSDIPQRKMSVHTGANNDYLMIKLSLNGECRNYLVHRLVASAWIKNPDNFPEIDHINKNVRDNRVENLRWCTRKQNIEWQEIDKGALNGLRSYTRLYKDSGEFIAAFSSITEACFYAAQNFGCSKTGMAKFHKSKGYFIKAENAHNREKCSKKRICKWELFSPEGVSLGTFNAKTDAGKYIKENIRDISIKNFSCRGRAYGYYVVEKSVETN